MTTADQERLIDQLERLSKSGVKKGLAQSFGPIAERIKTVASRTEVLERKAAIGQPGPQGIPGPQGEPGPVPRHEWIGTRLRFEQADGTWGEEIDLKGDRGPAGRSGRSGGGYAPSPLPFMDEAPVTDILYNDVGQIVSYTRNGVSYAFTYATVGGLSLPSTKVGGGVTVTFVYNEAGQLTSEVLS